MTELLQIELESSKIVALDALAAHAGKRRDELVVQAVEDLLALELQQAAEGIPECGFSRAEAREKREK